MAAVASYCSSINQHPLFHGQVPSQRGNSDSLKHWADLAHLLSNLIRLTSSVIQNLLTPLLCKALSAETSTKTVPGLVELLDCISLKL